MKSLRKTLPLEGVLTLILIVSSLYSAFNYVIFLFAEKVTLGDVLTSINNTSKFVFWCCLSYPGFQAIGHSLDISAAKRNLQTLKTKSADDQTLLVAKENLKNREDLADEDHVTSKSLLYIGILFFFISLILDAVLLLA